MFSRAGALRHALHVEAVPVLDELPVHDRQAVADVRPRVLARDRVHRVRAQRMLDRRARGAVAERFVDARGMQREVLADVARVDGDAGVLADEVALGVGDLDVAEDRVQHADARDGRLARRGVLERVAEILRDVLQRPDVEVRGGVLDRVLKSNGAVGGDVRARAARGPALVVHRDGVERHVRVRVLDVAVEHRDVAAEAHRADAGLVQEAHQLVLELRDERIGVASPDRPRDRLFREVHRIVCRAADADADDARAGRACRRSRRWTRARTA